MEGLVPVQNEGKGVEGSKSGVNQNENLHILKGKAVVGAKCGIIQEENLHLLRGEVVEAEIPKPAKAPKDKSTAKKAQKSNSILTDEDKCQEWAKDGIEHMHFTYSDMRKLEDQQKEQRVERDIALALGGLREWSDIWTEMIFGVKFPVEEDPKEDTLQLKFLPEVLPPSSPPGSPPGSFPGSPYRASWSESLLEIESYMEDERLKNLNIPMRLKEDYEYE